MQSVPTRYAVLLCVLLLAAAGCLATSPQEGRHDGQRDAPEPETTPGLSTAPPGPDVGVVQLYPEGREADLPILSSRDRRQLVLSFDLLGHEGRPLSIYFYHADRQWRRDLSPIEYMEGFRRDNLTEYTLSHAREPSYVHYEYAFPNDDVSFTVSGNYIVRVTEQGSEDDVLFERAFFLSEESASAQFALNRHLVGGSQRSALQPVLRLVPPESLGADVFDFSTCFAANGRLEEARCSDRPITVQQPGLMFELDPDQAFQSQRASYFLDVADLSVGSNIVDVDRSTTPQRVVLEEDLARFPDSDRGPLLHGQSRIGEVVRDAADPDVGAEYVEVVFRYVPPDERPLRGDVYISGSFNNWHVSEENRMTWQPANNWYEGRALVKQGQYEYHYVSKDARLRRVLRQSLPNARSLYTAFAYYRDASIGTDRLLSVQQQFVR